MWIIAFAGSWERSSGKLDLMFACFRNRGAYLSEADKKLALTVGGTAA